MVSAEAEYGGSMAEKASILSAHQAIAEWDVISSFFALAMPYNLGRTSLEAIKQSVIDGYAMVMIVWDPDPKAPVIHAAFLIECDSYPHKRVMNIAMCGGSKIEQWAHLWPQLKASAKAQGFDQIEINGRPGWGKFITAKETSRTFVEEL